VSQYHLPTDTSEHTPPYNPSQTVRQARITYPGGIESRVDLGNWLHTEMVCPPTEGHPSKY